ncbi:MAG TPA: ribosome biogenesis factor YjgA [Accumulibacter sp.]|nr:ribosome biogenesis factor YjgA [Accumulibacter sp.]
MTSTTSADEQALLSKTQRKKAMAELQALGEDLVDLSPDGLKKIDLPEDLRAAVRVAQGMRRQDDARRRQLQFIGRLMRDVDAEPIRRSLAVVRGDSADETARLHRLERLRSELLADEKVLFRLASETPAIDLQHLRSLRRRALLEQAQGKPPRCYREIFQFLKALESEVEALSTIGDPHAHEL